MRESITSGQGGPMPGWSHSPGGQWEVLTSGAGRALQPQSLHGWGPIRGSLTSGEQTDSPPDLWR